MKEYLDKLFSSRIPENKGYQYVRTEDIFIPILRVNLTIVKRKSISLTVLEEMILRIVECGVSDIDEIAGILGLDRDIITITLADLHFRNLSQNTANNCIITAKGKEALLRLSIIKRETDVIRDLYVNTGNNTISMQSSRFLVNEYTREDHLLETNTTADNIDFYKALLGELQDVFSEINSNNFALSENQRITEELLSIEDVDIRKTQYMRMPIHIYIGSNGNEYDIVPQESLQRSVFNHIKELIFASIKNGRLLKDVFSHDRAVNFPEPQGNFIGANDYFSTIKECKKNKSLSTNDIEEIITTNRKLLNNELEIIFDYLIKSSNTVIINLNNADIWTKSSKFLTLLSSIPSKVSFEVNYAQCSNPNLVFKRIKRVRTNINKNQINSYEHKDWLKIIFDSKYEIIGVPNSYFIDDIELHLLHVNYFFKSN